MVTTPSTVVVTSPLMMYAMRSTICRIFPMRVRLVGDPACRAWSSSLTLGELNLCEYSATCATQPVWGLFFGVLAPVDGRSDGEDGESSGPRRVRKYIRSSVRGRSPEGIHVFHRALRSAVFMLLISVVAGCSDTRMTTPVRITDFRATPKPIGIDVSFLLVDSLDRSTVLLFGAGVVRIMEPDSSGADTLSSVAKLDTARLLYNRQIIISREFFVRQTGDGIPVERCELGVFPYKHFLRAPRTPDGVVWVAVISKNGKQVFRAHARVRWPTEVMDRPEIFGSMKPFAGGG